MTKVERITNTLQETRQRRETQKPTVYELKLQNLSRRKAEVLRKAFLEAKWLYNWLVSDTERLSIPANKVSAVEVKAQGRFPALYVAYSLSKVSAFLVHRQFRQSIPCCA